MTQPSDRLACQEILEKMVKDVWTSLSAKVDLSTDTLFIKMWYHDPYVHFDVLQSKDIAAYHAAQEKPMDTEQRDKELLAQHLEARGMVAMARDLREGKILKGGFNEAALTAMSAARAAARAEALEEAAKVADDKFADQEVNHAQAVERGERESYIGFSMGMAASSLIASAIRALAEKQ